MLQSLIGTLPSRGTPISELLLMSLHEWMFTLLWTTGQLPMTISHKILGILPRGNSYDACL